MTAVSASAEIRGLPELERAQKRFAERLADLTATHRLVAERLLPGVASRTPVLTGALYGSWEARGSSQSAEVVSEVTYAGPVEYGVPGRTLPARMVAATLAAEEAEILRTYDEEIARIAREEGWEVR